MKSLKPSSSANSLPQLEVNSIKTDVKLIKNDIEKLKQQSSSRQATVDKKFEDLTKLISNIQFQLNANPVFNTPIEFTDYLARLPVKNNELVVENVIFNSTMYGFKLPSNPQIHKLSFKNSLAPVNMARFFSKIELPGGEIDLTGLDMSRTISMSKCFMGTKCRKLFISPAVGPQGLESIAFLCRNSEIEWITIENLLNISILNAIEAFAYSTVKVIVFNGFSQLNHACNLSKMFYSCKELKILDLSNLNGTVNDLSFFIAECPKLTEFIMPNLMGVFCEHVTTFVNSSNLMNKFVINSSFIAETVNSGSAIKLKNRNSTIETTFGKVKSAELDSGVYTILLQTQDE